MTLTYQKRFQEGRNFRVYQHDGEKAHLWDKYQRLPFATIADEDEQIGKNVYENWLLRKDKINFFTEKPINKMLMKDVRYDMERAKKTAKPVEMFPTFVINNSQVRQALSRTLTYTVEKTTMFETSETIQGGVEAKISHKVPGVGKIWGSVEIGLKNTKSFNKKVVTTETDSITAVMQVSEESKAHVSITANKYEMDIPYTGILTKWYADGSVTKEFTRGTYKSVDFAEFAVNYGREEKISFEEQTNGVEPISPKEPVKPIPPPKRYNPDTVLTYRFSDARKILFRQWPDDCKGNSFLVTCFPHN